MEHVDEAGSAVKRSIGEKAFEQSLKSMAGQNSAIELVGMSEEKGKEARFDDSEAKKASRIRKGKDENEVLIKRSLHVVSWLPLLLGIYIFESLRRPSGCRRLLR